MPRSRQAAIQETSHRRRVREAQRVADEAAREAKPIPSNCRRVINTPLPPNIRGYCDAPLEGCPGIQRDGSCLAQIVMAAQDQGLDWKFEVNPDPADPSGQHVWWDYIGPELAPYEPRLPDNVPPELYVEPEPTHADFHCPHCGNDEVLPVGFYWCSACGKNANDP